MFEFFTKSSSLIKYFIAFIFVTIIEIILLVSVSVIPRQAIQDNMLESAYYLCEDSVFFYANSKDMSSKIDRYADSILLNITYHLDSQNPLSSAMSSSYYFNITENENENLLYTVTNQTEPTLKYSRYWHGSIVFVRPLLMLFNIKQIYLLNSVLIICLALVLLFNMYKIYGIASTICAAIGFASISIWYVPMSLEYTWTILLMLVTSILCILLLKKGQTDFILFFFITGSTTAYIDFLTTETLTLLIPMSLIILYHRDELTTFKKESVICIKQASAWCIGYGATWLSKWTLASIILQSNEFTTALSQASYRASDTSDSLSGMQLRLSAEFKNIAMLFPFSLTKDNAAMLCALFFTIIIVIIYLIRKSKYVMNKLLLIIAIVPYIRYFILSNHSYMHHFFTFRAQFATVFCLLLILVYGSDKQLISKELKKLHRKK